MQTVSRSHSISSCRLSTDSIACELKETEPDVEMNCFDELMKEYEEKDLGKGMTCFDELMQEYHASLHLASLTPPSLQPNYMNQSPLDSM
jgi:uncharacterized protein YozE (UPF0346 family)